jgi:hypothetical protein
LSPGARKACRPVGRRVWDPGARRPGRRQPSVRPHAGPSPAVRPPAGLREAASTICLKTKQRLRARQPGGPRKPAASHRSHSKRSMHARRGTLLLCACVPAGQPAGAGPRPCPRASPLALAHCSMACSWSGRDDDDPTCSLQMCVPHMTRPEEKAATT